MADIEKIDPQQLRELQRRVLKFGMDENHAFRYYRLGQLINSFDKKEILNIGCGKGFLEQLIHNYDSIVALDISCNDIAIARKNNRQKQNIEFITADFLKFDFDKKFDMIIFSEVIEHVKDDDLFIKKITRLLKPEGILIFTVPNREKLSNKFLYPLQGRIKMVSYDHLREYTVPEVIKLLNSHDFEVIFLGGAYLKLLFEYTLRKYNLFRPESNFRIMLENFFFSHFKNYNTYLIIVAKPKLQK